MLLRNIQFRASILGISLSTAFALAQEPPAPSPAVEAAYPASATNYAAAEPIASDGWNYDWQVRFQAEALYMKRNNHSQDIPVITGSESFRFSDLNFDYEPGSRLTFSLMEDDYEFEVSFLSLGDWRVGGSRTLIHGLDFDGPEAYAGAIPAQPAVDIGSDPIFISTGTYFAPVNGAANAAAEINELEFLAAGATLSTKYRSNLQDLEANFKQRSQPGRALRLGLGFRSLTFREGTGVTLAGAFDTVDTDGSDPGAANNGLADGSLTGAGLTLVTGTTADGFDTAPTTLVFSSRTNVRNQLNGVQVVLDAMAFESDYVTFGAFGKAGVFHNDAQATITERYTETADGSAYSRQLIEARETFAFVAHAGLNSRWTLHRHVRVLAGYEVMYLTGLALAPEQMKGISPVAAAISELDLRTHGSVFIHGGRLGLEIVY